MRHLAYSTRKGGEHCWQNTHIAISIKYAKSSLHTLCKRRLIHLASCDSSVQMSWILFGTEVTEQGGGSYIRHRFCFSSSHPTQTETGWDLVLQYHAMPPNHDQENWPHCSPSLPRTQDCFPSSPCGSTCGSPLFLYHIDTKCASLSTRLETSFTL